MDTFWVKVKRFLAEAPLEDPPKTEKNEESSTTEAASSSATSEEKKPLLKADAPKFEEIPQCAQKSYKIALFLWMFGGVFGAHHFYLGRDIHAVIFMFSLGGFGLGWLYDFTCLEAYVKWANFDLETQKKHHEKVCAGPISEGILKNLSSTVFVEIVISTMRMLLLSEDTLGLIIYRSLDTLLVVAVVAILMYMISNIGDTEAEFMPTLKGALCYIPLRMVFSDNPIWSIILARNFQGKTRKYRKKPKNRPVGRTLLLAIFVFSCLLAIFAFYLTNVCKIESETGYKIPCVSSIKNIWNAPIWKDTMRIVEILINFQQAHGWSGLWNHILQEFDATGEERAREVLGVQKYASEADLKHAYKTLSKQYHPDKQKTPEQKLLAQEKFIAIQQAYEILSQSKSNRVKNNKRPRMNPGQKVESEPGKVEL